MKRRISFGLKSRTFLRGIVISLIPMESESERCVCRRLRSYSIGLRAVALRKGSKREKVIVLPTHSSAILYAVCIYS